MRQPHSGATTQEPRPERASGTRVELVWMRPHDHIGWAFDGPEDFAHVAGAFLREGLDLGERLLLVVPDPTEDAYQRLAASLGPDNLLVMSTADVYGASGVVAAAAQRAAFATALRLAEADGYTGIRVAADNSTLVDGPVRLAAWFEWELLADRFMSENRVTGLCGFDSRRVDVNTLRHLATVHPLSAAHAPQPQFRLYVDGDGLCLEGDVDEIALDLLQRALLTVPRGTPEVVDLSRALIRGASTRSSLAMLERSGVTLTM